MFEKFTSAVKEILGEKHDITESVREGLADRLSSPFYGYFLVSWFIVNWDFVYSAFFVDGKIIYEKTKLLKNEYLLQKILPVHYVSFEYWWAFLVLPLILTFVALWPMQFVTRLVYRKHIENKKAEEMIKASALVVKAEAEVKQAKIEKAAEEVSPKLIWKREFDEFKKHSLFSEFQKVIDCVYSNGGKIYNKYYDEDVHEWFEFSLPQDMLVYADVNGLIIKGENVITLTDKGREFVKTYTNREVS
jgi:hypothetical protein